MRIIVVKPGCYIPIGRLGENEATKTLFPVEEWVESYGEGVFSLLVQRNGDANPYPAVVDVEEFDGKTHVAWIVTDADVARVGRGKCELIYTVGGVVAKSEIYVTITGEALSSAGDPPEPWEDWVARVIAAGAQAEIAADSASESATSAAESAEIAVGKATEAGASAENADTSARAAQDAANSMSFVSFDIDPDGSLYVNRSERLGTTAFILNDDGELEVSI